MKISITGSGTKISLILLDILSILMILSVAFDFEYELFFNIFIIIISSLLSLILLSATFISFGIYEVDNNGIAFNSLIYKKFCKWSDFKFIAKYNTEYKLEFKTGFICSHKLEKNKFKRLHTTCDFSVKYFNIPYSKELEKFILMYSSNTYEGLLIDDSKSK